MAARAIYARQGKPVGMWPPRSRKRRRDRVKTLLNTAAVERMTLRGWPNGTLEVKSAPGWPVSSAVGQPVAVACGGREPHLLIRRWSSIALHDSRGLASLSLP